MPERCRVREGVHHESSCPVSGRGSIKTLEHVWVAWIVWLETHCYRK